ncbi:sensor histidine kinase [Crocinitomix algicola]|uniref:sensor histidine kinase n=1 Tax=Crocinitomix algicola TaxID=1740263 RepID=UPI0009F1F075|nr:ATP-binding protein [Crocinitomix algicola]
MTKMDFDSSRLSKNLAERVKELDCLYKISRIAAIHKQNIDEALRLIMIEIPKGWQFPEQIGANLQFDGQLFGEKISSKHQQNTIFQINKTVTATLTVFYKDQPKTGNNPFFLMEEQALLNQIGFEIASLIEIDLKNKKEALINEKLRKNDRLNLLSEITAGIAQELTGPLQNILKSSEELNISDNEESNKSALERIVSDTNEAKEIVKKLKFFASDMPSELTVENLNEIVKDAFTILSAKIKEKNIQSYTNLSNGLPSVKLDRSQFTQVVLNIIINAIDAMEDGGTLTITTTGINKDVRLKIKDSGKGIPMENFKKIFEPFYTTKTTSGAGLGLSVAHGIVQSHGGRIEVDSTIGQGTTFTVIMRAE